MDKLACTDESYDFGEALIVPCAFRRIWLGTEPAVVAQMNFVVAEAAQCDRLMQHRAELAARLPLLSMKVCAVPSGQSFWQLQAALMGSVTTARMSTFLNQLTQDFHLFWGYAKAQGIALEQTQSIPSSCKVLLQN